MPADSAVILHHYDASPFSHKVRTLFGLKGIEWRSVITPNMMPKPDLVPLTGGYRRAPVMQIGSDIYCDSQVIMAEIERRHPDPVADIGAAWPINLWADRLFFQLTVAIVFGSLGDQVDPSFVADREKLSGRPFDVQAMAAAVGPAKSQWRGQVRWIDRALATRGEPFLSGGNAGIADVSASMNIWFLAAFFPDLANDLCRDFAALAAWQDRLAGLGEGTRLAFSSAEALDIARNSEPAQCPIAHDRKEAEGLSPGDAVVVMADDYGRDPISGSLVAADAERIVLQRRSDDLGSLQLHFPRVGFILSPARG